MMYFSVIIRYLNGLFSIFWKIVLPESGTRVIENFGLDTRVSKYPGNWHPYSQPRHIVYNFSTVFHHENFEVLQKKP
jgi:hypothetical protein